MLMSERLPLLALTSAAALVERLLPEREPHPDTFASLSALIEILDADENWLPRYVEWELGFLNQLGYGLDLTECAATGSTDDLVFVSLAQGVRFPPVPVRRTGKNCLICRPSSWQRSLNVGR